MSSADLDTIAMLRDSAQRYARESYSFHQRWPVLQEPEGFSRKAWNDLAGMGLLALHLPEEEGGLNGDAAAMGALMEIVGANLLMEPVLASAIVCAGLLSRFGSAAQRAELLPRVTDGSIVMAFAHEDERTHPCLIRDDRLVGTKLGVLHGDVADRFLVTARDAQSDESSVVLVAAGAEGVARRNYKLVDGRGAAALTFDEAVIERLQPASGLPAAAALAEVRDEAAVALCAESLGIIRRLLAITNEYLKVRKQFGKPIGANQALQHRIVDCFLLHEEARALVAAAQQALAGPVHDRARIVSGARAYVIRAARMIANEAVQMHGGLGVTDELEVSHYFRRLMVNASMYGGRDAHFARFVEATIGHGSKPGHETGSKETSHAQRR